MTIGKLALALRPLQPQVIDNLAFGDVKAEAEFVVELPHVEP